MPFSLGKIFIYMEAIILAIMNICIENQLWVVWYNFNKLITSLKNYVHLKVCCPAKFLVFYGQFGFLIGVNSNARLFLLNIFHKVQETQIYMIHHDTQVHPLTTMIYHISEMDKFIVSPQNYSMHRTLK